MENTFYVKKILLKENFCQKMFCQKNLVKNFLGQWEFLSTNILVTNTTILQDVTERKKLPGILPLIL